jgi:hypothetical protein
VTDRQRGADETSGLDLWLRDSSLTRSTVEEEDDQSSLAASTVNMCLLPMEMSALMDTACV